MAPDPSTAYRDARRAHWDRVAARGGAGRRGLGGYYHRRLNQIYRLLIAPGQRVLELGCGRGDLLAAVEPSRGVGVDFSHAMLTQARARHTANTRLSFVEADVHGLELDGTFDVVVMSELVNDLWDVQAVLQRVRRFCHSRTRLILNFYSRLWQPPLALARKLGAADPVLEQNWLAPDDVRNLLALSGFEPIRHWPEILWPVRTPGADALCNRVLVKLWPVKHLGMTNMMVARPLPPLPGGEGAKAPLVSVIVPARNESGNIPAVFARTPEMGAGTELVFVEGHSSDDTYAAIERGIAAHPHRRAKLLRQTGKGKGDAVRAGFAAATGDVLMILDADLTVPPEDLPRFYEALATGKGEFINGVRLVYPMERQSMQFLNQVANKLFGLAFSWLLGQGVKDTLCGTKVLRRRDYDLIAANRRYFGDFDPFGDFDLLFGAARLNLKITDLPIRYRERTYGTTNINRFRHGWLLLRMTWFAAWRIKFV